MATSYKQLKAICGRINADLHDKGILFTYFIGRRNNYYAIDYTKDFNECEYGNHNLLAGLSANDCKIILQTLDHVLFEGLVK